MIIDFRTELIVLTYAQYISICFLIWWRGDFYSCVKSSMEYSIPQNNDYLCIHEIPKRELGILGIIIIHRNPDF